MSKLANYLGIIGMVLIGFYLVGFMEDSGSIKLLSLLTNPSQMFQLEFFLDIQTALSSLALAGIAIGLVLYGRSDQAGLLIFTGTMLGIGSDVLLIYNKIAEFSGDFALLIISPLLLVYLLTCLEWWRGLA